MRTAWKSTVIFTIVIVTFIVPTLVRRGDRRDHTVVTVRGVLPVAVQVYVAGDSITDGRYSPDGLYAWWRDGFFVQVARDVGGLYAGGQVTQVAHGGGCLVAVGCAGPPAVEWMYPEVLDTTPRPSTVILELGLNDLGLVTTQRMWDAYASLYFAAVARGIRLVVGTINPTCANRPGWATWESQRAAVNNWIRANLPYVADFDGVLRRPGGGLDPIFSLFNCTGSVSDLIHPGVLGAYEMAFQATRAIV